jgi:hypothetical protein
MEGRMEMSQLRGAPVATSLPIHTMRNGLFKPERVVTSDLLETIELGTFDRNVVYNTTLSPQSLPGETRARYYTKLYAKYRPKNVTIRILSAIPTVAGGQYGAFFDPNPDNNWLLRNASTAITSMPCNVIASAWESSKLCIPPSQLERNTVLYTEDQSNETLVTQFGQLVIVCLAVANTTPAGSGKLTIWVDAEWEFYEPNISAALDATPNIVPAGNWDVDGSTKAITHPNSVPGINQHTVYRMIPALPDVMFTPAVTCEWVASRASTDIVGFETLQAAQAYAQGGPDTTALARGAGPFPVALDIESMIVVNQYQNVSRQLPFKL